MERIEFDGKSLIPVAGMMVDGVPIVGLFLTTADAMSEDADKRVFATVRTDRLTPEQMAIAEANAQAMPSDF